MNEYEFTDEDVMREEMMDARKHDDKLREIWEERRNRMTDTEKAEKEFDEYCEKNLMVDIYEKSMFTDGYLAGLEEGRKDRNCVNCSNHSSNLRKEKEELKKENAELKEKLKGFENGVIYQKLRRNK